VNKDSIELIAITVGCLTGLAGFLGGVYFYWQAKVKKSYAAERDFNHLRRNQENMVVNLNEILKEQDRRFDQLDLSINRVESMLHSLLRNPPPGER
jgi:hypothetical protein